VPTIVRAFSTAWKVNLGNARRAVVWPNWWRHRRVGYELLRQQQLFTSGAMAWTLRSSVRAGGAKQTINAKSRPGPCPMAVSAAAD